MEKLKIFLFSVVVLLIIILIGYWAVITLQSGTEHVTDKKIEQLEKENQDLKDEIKMQNDKISLLESKIEEPIVNEKKEQKEFTYKYQSLIDKLQKLVSDNTFLKQGSNSEKVGIVQEFLNVYKKTSNKIDNDYGPSTVKAVKDFQKDFGLHIDGEAGADTFKQMINWLKKQG